MTIQIKHAFQSLKGDGGDATLVRPSVWNAAHTTSMNSGNVVGRRTAGVGEFEEIPITAAGAAILAANDASSFGFTTGDVKPTLKSVADAGWIFWQDGTIGDASSGATIRANADTQALFTLLWNGFAQGVCVVSGGRGASPAADYAAHKTITLPPGAGRALGIAGGGAGLTFRTPGDAGGLENTTLTYLQIPPLSTNGIVVTTSTSASAIGSYTTAGNVGQNIALNPGGNFSVTGAGPIQIAASSASFVSGSINAGGGQPHSNLQPTVWILMMVKL